MSIEGTKKNPYGHISLFDEILKHSSLLKSEEGGSKIGKEAESRKQDNKNKNASLELTDPKTLKREIMFKSKPNPIEEIMGGYEIMNIEKYKKLTLKEFYTSKSTEEKLSNRIEDPYKSIDFNSIALYTLPRVEEIIDQGIYEIRDFKVYSKFGMIHFLEPVNLYDIKEDIIGYLKEILKFARGNFAFYPDPSIMPDFGEGLNVDFVVELRDIFIYDPSTGKPIIDYSSNSFKNLYPELIFRLHNIANLDLIYYNYKNGKALFNRKK